MDRSERRRKKEAQKQVIHKTERFIISNFPTTPAIFSRKMETQN